MVLGVLDKRLVVGIVYGEAGGHGLHLIAGALPAFLLDGPRLIAHKRVSRAVDHNLCLIPAQIVSVKQDDPGYPAAFLNHIHRGDIDQVFRSGFLQHLEHDKLNVVRTEGRNIVVPAVIPLVKAAVGRAVAGFGGMDRRPPGLAAPDQFLK